MAQQVVWPLNKPLPPKLLPRVKVGSLPEIRHSFSVIRDELNKIRNQLDGSLSHSNQSAVSKYAKAVHSGRVTHVTLTSKYNNLPCCNTDRTPNETLRYYIGSQTKPGNNRLKSGKKLHSDSQQNPIAVFWNDKQGVNKQGKPFYKNCFYLGHFRSVRFVHGFDIDDFAEGRNKGKGKYKVHRRQALIELQFVEYNEEWINTIEKAVNTLRSPTKKVARTNTTVINEHGKRKRSKRDIERKVKGNIKIQVLKDIQWKWFAGITSDVGGSGKRLQVYFPSDETTMSLRQSEVQDMGEEDWNQLLATEMNYGEDEDNVIVESSKGGQDSSSSTSSSSSSSSKTTLLKTKLSTSLELTTIIRRLESTPAQKYQSIIAAVKQLSVADINMIHQGHGTTYNIVYKAAYHCGKYPSVSSLALVEALIKPGVDLNITNTQTNHTPLSVSIFWKNPSLALLLLKNGAHQMFNKPIIAKAKTRAAIRCENADVYASCQPKGHERSWKTVKDDYASITATVEKPGEPSAKRQRTTSSSSSSSSFPSSPLRLPVQPTLNDSPPLLSSSSSSQSCCVVCQDEKCPLTYAAIPCGHLCLCTACFKKHYQNGGDCPNCRQNVQNWCRIFTNKQ